MEYQTKAQFLARPKLRGLSAAEKDRRWKNHCGSLAGLSAGGAPSRRRITGRGNYNTPLVLQGRGNYGNFQNTMRSVFPSGSFARAGATLGGAAGGQPGSSIGRGLGGLASRILGFGDYTVQTNTLMNAGNNQNQQRAMQSSFAATGAARIRLTRREFIGQVFAGANPDAFEARRFRIQPTDSTTFPWGHVIARNFSEYELHGCIFTFESTSSNYSANTALGTIACATQYNAGDPSFSDMDGMLNSAYNSRGNPSQTVQHPIECDPQLQTSEHLYTRRPGITVNAPNNYDFGYFTVATEGLAAAAHQSLGRLYVTYDLELFMPLLPNPQAIVSHSLTCCLKVNAGGGEPNPLANMLGDGNTADNNVNGFTPSQWTLGTTATTNNITLFTPSVSGVNTPSYMPEGSAENFIWVCGSNAQPAPAPPRGTIQYFNFRYGGRVSFTICTAIMAPQPATLLQVVPTLDFVGSTQHDVFCNYAGTSNINPTSPTVVSYTWIIDFDPASTSKYIAVSDNALQGVSYNGLPSSAQPPVVSIRILELE